MDSKRRNRRSSTPRLGAQNEPEPTDQADLWSHHSESAPAASDSTPSEELASRTPAHETRAPLGKSADRKAIQDLLFTEGLLAAILCPLDGLLERQGGVQRRFAQRRAEEGGLVW